MGRLAIAEIPAWFREQMGRMLGLKFHPADLTTHWEALSDVPADVLEAAVTLAQRTRIDFPTPAELRRDADQVTASRRVAVQGGPRFEDLGEATAVEIKNPFGGPSIFVRVDREWKDYCDSCRDTGFAHRTCPETHCGRTREHGAHEFVEPCPCRDWNPSIKRRKEAQMRYSEAQAQK